MEYKQMTLAEWLDIKQKLKQNISSAKDKLNGLKKDFVRIGYLLRKIDDNELYKQDGYKSIAEFAKAECDLSSSDTTRFIQINKKYSVGGNSEELRPEFLEYGQSKLAAMLALPDADLNMITPQTSREDIRELNRFNKSNPEQGADDDIDQLIRDFYISQELVRKAVTVKDDPKALRELIAPSGSRSFRKGIWFILFHESKINIKKYSGVAKEISWEEFTAITAKILEKYESEGGTTDGFKEDRENTEKEVIAPAQKSPKPALIPSEEAVLKEDKIIRWEKMKSMSIPEVAELLHLGYKSHHLTFNSITDVENWLSEEMEK